MARFILDFEIGRGTIVDDDDYASDDRYYMNNEKFEEDVKRLAKINGVAKNLVEELLKCKTSHRYVVT